MKVKRQSVNVKELQERSIIKAFQVNKSRKSTCSGADILDGEVAGALFGIHKANGKNDSPNVNHNAVNKGLSCSVNDPMSTCSSPHMDNGKVDVAGMGIHKADGQNDIPNANNNVVNQGICGLANDPMSTCSSLDMDNGEVAIAGMGIHKADGQNDIPNANDNMFDSQKNHSGIDVLQHDTHVDCSVAKLNDHPTSDIGVKIVPVDEFVDDYMDVLNDEESISNYSLDDMKLQDEEEKLISTSTPVNHQHVDELIDVHEDKTTVLQENMNDVSNKSQYVNVVKEDYKPCLGMVFANIKANRKKCGIERNCVLSPPKTISRSVNGDFIKPHEFLEDVSGEPKMRSINELVTLEVFVEQLSRPHNFIRDKVYFLVNEPKKHWCLAELHISTGVVTFYHSLGWVCENRKPWWRTMKRTLPHPLTLYLNEHGVLENKGIAVETYDIKYMFPKVVRQANDYGDCGVWVCIFLYRLSRNLSLTVDAPLQTALAYRERMLQYFWRHKIQPEKTVVLDEGTYQLIM
uniref:Phospholipase-like protein n=1 Tax=Tanacetum cinerariifolium TaxID=118510 RepID=A0A699GT10_TANCI|nr:phospholipase-like protein [Tanacetum cinerariifolium]